MPENLTDAQREYVNREVQLATLAVKQEETAHLLRHFVRDVKTRWSMEDDRHEEHLNRTRKIERDLNMYGTVYRFIKFVGAAFILIITLKIGDVAGLWQQIFNK